MKTLKTILLGAAIPFIVLLPLAAPTLALADSMQIHSNVWDINTLKGPLITCVGASTSTLPIQTTCTNFCDLVSTAANVVYFAIAFVIWIITPILLIWAGILFMISAGSAERLGQAKKMITGIVIGILVVLCAYLIVYTLVNVLQIQNYIGGFGTTTCTIAPSPAVSNGGGGSGGGGGGSGNTTTNCNPACTSPQICSFVASTMQFQCIAPPANCNGQCGLPVPECSGTCAPGAGVCTPKNTAWGTQYACIIGNTNLSSGCYVGGTVPVCVPGPNCQGVPGCAGQCTNYNAPGCPGQ